MSEQSKQIEAQKREDMLMDMYKLHAYIPNDAEGNPLTPFGNFCAGYEAATAEANKRIAELELEVQNWKDFCKKVQKVDFNDYLALEGEVARKQKLIDALDHNGGYQKLDHELTDTRNAYHASRTEFYAMQASNNDLREALEEMVDAFKHMQTAFNDCVFDKARKALSATPAESLQAFENEVLERAASLCVQPYPNDNDYQLGWNDAEAHIAQAIRSLKSKP